MKIITLILVFLCLNGPVSALHFPNSKDFFNDLLRPSAELIDQLQLSTIVTSLGDDCRVFAKVDDGIPRWELLQCVSRTVMEGYFEERVSFSLNGTVLQAMTLHSFKPHSNWELFHLRIDTLPEYASFEAYPGLEIIFGDETLVTSRYFNYRFILGLRGSPERRVFHYERRCAWCGSPNVVQAHQEEVNLHYYSDLFPSQAVTPLVFQQGLAQIYSGPLESLARDLLRSIEGPLF